MQAKREGRPQRAANELPTRNGLCRFPVEMPLELVELVDLLADREGLSRVRMNRRLVEEAIAERKKRAGA